MRKFLPCAKLHVVLKTIFTRIMVKGGTVYILTNKHHTTLYIGVTSDLISRMMEHRNRKYSKSFTARYNLTKLVFYESFHSIEEAIAKEKQIKAGSRKKKEMLIMSMNPQWNDLYSEVENW